MTESSGGLTPAVADNPHKGETVTRVPFDEIDGELLAKRQKLRDRRNGAESAILFAWPTVGCANSVVMAPSGQ